MKYRGAGGQKGRRTSNYQKPGSSEDKKAGYLHANNFSIFQLFNHSIIKNPPVLIKPLFSVLITITVVLFFHFSKIYVLKFYPVIVNTFIFCVFFSSLFCNETIIQKFAKRLDGELTDFSRNYTRKLTYVWCVFLLINLLISIATVFMSSKIWELYNACISYIALGIMFGVEYVVRIILRNKYDKR